VTLLPKSIEGPRIDIGGESVNGLSA